MSLYRSAATAIVVSAIAFLLAISARYRLIEPANITFLCDGGSREVLCSVRSWIIQSFVHQRIGWLALAIASVAMLTGWRLLAGIALFLACAGLILYTTELCAPAALLALLVFVRGGHTVTTASSTSSTPYDNA